MATQKKILVIEDNPINLRFVLLTLRNQGYLLLSATNGDDGLRITNEEKPDLIIADIQLPKMDGLDLIRKLREMSPVANTPAIALTAYVMEGDRERVFDAGYDAYVPKPVSITELRHVVEHMLNYTRM